VHPETGKGHVYQVPRGGGTYTCLTVARLLSWTKGGGKEPTRTCRIALDAWHSILRYTRAATRAVRRRPIERSILLVTRYRESRITNQSTIKMNAPRTQKGPTGRPLIGSTTNYQRN
jgi:hypothetical protein